nr:MAG: ORF2 [Parvoviridae sp.]
MSQELVSMADWIDVIVPRKRNRGALAESAFDKQQRELKAKLVKQDQDRVDGYIKSFHENYDIKTHSFPKHNTPGLSRGYVPPPLVYTGPGNSLDLGPAYNEADEDAKHHDHQYHFAKTQDDVRESDQQLKAKGLDHVVEGISGKGSISNAITGGLQAAGIGIKNLFEVDSVKYPQNLPSEYATTANWYTRLST